MKNIIPIYKKIAFYGLLVIMLISCKNEDKLADNTISLKLSIDKGLGANLQIPDGLRVYTPFPSYVADSIQMSYAHSKIYTYINASCVTCIEEINMWSKIIDNALYKNAVVFLIFHSNDNFELFKHLCETGEVKESKFPFFFDWEGEYLSMNSFMKDSNHLETVLTDKENKILLMGNPLRSKDIEKSYFDEIDKNAKIFFGDSKVIIGKPKPLD